MQSLFLTTATILHHPIVQILFDSLFANKEEDVYQQYSKNYSDKTVAYFGCNETMSPS